ncbi:hypothetical protein QTP88_003867 [Uroleucon formosanum]
MAKHQIQNWVEEIDTEISDYDLSDEEDLVEQLLENNKFLENMFDGTGKVPVQKLGWGSLETYVHCNRKKKKKRRGSYDFKVETENNISLVCWFDRKSINLLSSYTSVEPVGPCKRWSMSDKKFIDVPRPHVVEEYIKFMGGVTYCKWLLHRRHLKQRKEKLKMSLLEFQTNTAATLCDVTVTRKRGRPSTETVNSPTEMSMKKKLILHQHQYLTLN